MLKRWRDKPSLFVQDAFKIKPHGEQAKVLDAFSQKNPRAQVAYRAFRGEGKTSVEAWLMLLFPLIWEDVVVITTSGTWRQVKDIQWREMRRWWDRAAARGFKLGPKPLTTQWQAKPNCLVTGCSAKDPGKIEGYHAQNVLMIIDECKAVDRAIFNATRGFRQGAKVAQCLCASTPGPAEGWFYELFTREDWKSFHADGEKSDHCDREWLEECAREWGTDSALYLSQCRGEFYAVSTGGLVSLEKLEAARAGPDELEVNRRDPIQLGIDVGAGGDLSAFLARQGPIALDAETHDLADPMQLTGQARMFYQKTDTDLAVIDTVGVGHGIGGRLKELGCNVFRYNAGTRASNRERFKLRRSEDYWGLRDRFENGDIDLSAIAPDFYRRLAGQLSTLSYAPNSRGQIVIESKADYKRRMSRERGPDFARSPDEADALVMAYANVRGHNKTKVASGSERKLTKF